MENDWLDKLVKSKNIGSLKIENCEVNGKKIDLIEVKDGVVIHDSTKDDKNG